MRASTLSLSRSGLARAGSDLGLACLYLAFAWAHAVAFMRQPRASIILLVLLEALFAFFFVTRRGAHETSASTIDWLSTSLGTLLPLLLRPTAAADAPLGQAIQTAGAALGVAGILSLNRSVGLLPANRGIRSGGPYALVRHPLYLSYTLSHAGYLCSHFTSANVAVATLALAAQLVRIEREERLLSQDPGYRAYVSRTRWRLVPGLY